MNHYQKMGEEPVLFVIEMGLGACIEEWIPFANRLKELGSVLLYERAGINRSPATNTLRTPEQIAYELNELLTEIPHEEQIILIAHSQGGLYAQEFCRRYPERVRGLLLLDPLSAFDNQFKEQLSEKEYKKSGVDKSANLIYMEKLVKLKLGWLIKKMMKSAPPFYYDNSFDQEATDRILNSFTKTNHLRTAYQEYQLAHEKENLIELMDMDNFPSIPLTLITHSSSIAIEESMSFGHNTREFATKIEEMWQGIMKQYLNLSSLSTYIQAEHSSHYIHLTEPDIILTAVKDLMNKVEN